MEKLWKKKDNRTPTQGIRENNYVKISKLNIILFLLLIVFITSTVVFNRMYMSYRQDNKKIKSENETLVNTVVVNENGLKRIKTGVDLHLKQLYSNTVRGCNNDTEPSYVCSGLLVHGLRLQEQVSPWSHRDIDKNVSVAFSYLRDDHKYASSVDYSSGIILYPKNKIPEMKDSYTVLCAYPIDGWTDGKKNHAGGCGNYNEDLIDQGTKDNIARTKLLKAEGTCLDNNLNTAEEWFKFHRKNNYFVNKSDLLSLFTCSYPMDGDDKRISSFNVLSDIRKEFDQNEEIKPANWNNEILISAWDEEHPERLPVMAIFYTKDNISSLNSALLYQRAFFDRTNEMIPVVEIKFPKDKYDTAEFKEYIKN